MDEFIYLDHAATTFLGENIRTDLMKFYAIPHGNPSAMHRLGFEASQKLGEARRYFATAFCVKPENVIFTAHGTEANNLALSGYLQRKRGVILVSPTEHASVLRVIEKWEKEGCKIKYLKVDKYGLVDTEDFSRQLSSDVVLVSVMAVNNEIGTIQPIAEIGKRIKEKHKKILFHVDAVQAFGKISLEAALSHIDFLTLSSHKIHGPVGAGALILRENILIDPVQYGGGQEFGLRPGTENLAAIYGFYRAAREILDQQKIQFERMTKLHKAFRLRIEALPFPKKINSPIDGSPYILNVSFIGCPSEVLLRMLEEEKIYVSAGSACNMKKNKPSSVLTAIGCSEKEFFSAIRFSFSPYTKASELEKTVEVLHLVLSRFHSVL